MSRAVVAILGGGAFAPRLCEALAREPALPPLDLRLVARRPERLAIIAAHAARRVSAIRPEFRVESFSSVGPAVQGARAVVLLIRVGGHAARAHDEDFPRAFGLVGDEGIGVGGIANAYRTVPVLADLAGLLRDLAGGATVLNLMAPLGVTTRLLLDAGLDATGVCELPLVTIERLASEVGATPESLAYRYAGLNHLGWFWDVRWGERDLLEAAIGAGLADEEVLARFGAAPLHYYYEVFDPAAGQRLGRARAPGRARWLRALSDQLVSGYSDDAGGEAPAADARSTPWFERAVVPILAAVLGGPAHHGFANVRNHGLVPALPADAVVEVRATVDSAGVHPIASGRAPDVVERFLVAAARAEDLALRAASARSPELVAEAIRALPLPLPLPIPPASVTELARLACAPVPPDPA